MSGKLPIALQRGGNRYPSLGAIARDDDESGVRIPVAQHAASRDIAQIEAAYREKPAHFDGIGVQRQLPLDCIGDQSRAQHGETTAQGKQNQPAARLGSGNEESGDNAPSDANEAADDRNGTGAGRSAVDPRIAAASARERLKILV